MGFEFSFNKKDKEGNKLVNVNLGMDKERLSIGLDDSLLTDSDLSFAIDKEDVDEFSRAWKEAGEIRKLNREKDKERKNELKKIKYENKTKRLKSSNND